MSWPPPVELVGRHSWLVPLRPDHADALAEAVRDGELWKLWYTHVPSPAQMATALNTECKWLLRREG